MTNEQKRKQLTAMFGAYDKRLERLYGKFIDKLTALAASLNDNVKEWLDIDPLFAFDHFPELQPRLNRIFSDYVQNDMLAYKSGITDGVALAYSHDNSVLTGFSILSDKALSTARKTAAETFIRSRLTTKEGLNLSQLVWNYCSQTKSEFEMAMSNVISDGLKKGTSAEELGRAVRQYLNNPDMMYRRYHRTVVDAQGNKKDIVKWRRRIIDENGKVRFVEEPLEQVGMGHYRSSRKNATRLMRTEINMAYHNANNARWKNEPFVIGIMIDLSPQHPEEDECDILKGRYPKDFDFIGWHVQCMCAAYPITLQGDEKKEFYRRLATGEDMSNYVSPHAVKDVPQGFKDYVESKHDKFVSAGERGKLGYVWRNNPKYLRPLFSKEEQEKMGILLQPKKRIKSDAEKAAIQMRWDERKRKNALIKKTGQNVWKVANNLGYTETLQTKALLREAIVDDNSMAISKYSKQLAKQIAMLNREARWMESTIPNAKEWLQQFTLADIKQVEKVVVDNLAKWNDKYITDTYLKSKYKTAEEFLIAKLKSEAQYVVDETYLKPHSLYPTSKVAESAYLNKVSVIEHKIEMDALSKELKEIKEWSVAHPKSKKVAGLWQEAETLLSEDKDIATIKQKIKEAQNVIDAREKEYFRKGKKNQTGDIFFSEERKNAAIWDTGNGQLADDTLFDSASQAWLKATKKEKDKIYEYTHHYCDKNEPLQGRKYIGNQSRATFENKVNAITKYIERNELPEDMWFMRGDSDISVIRSRIEFAGGTWPSDLQDLVGMTMQEGAFMSTASRRGSGFDSKKVIINVFAPKGTKAAYVEPFSQFGCGAERDWDGLQKFTSFSKEQETLFQRGTKMRITKIYNDGYKTYIDVEVIGQELKDLSYVLDENIGY